MHLREPGFGWKETIESGARAAAAGGFTTVVCMPNTSPAADSPSTIAWIKDRAAEAACVNVLPAGAISKGLAGEELAPIGSLAQAGVVAITDDGHCIQNNELMRRAVEYARMVGVPVLDHCQDYNLVGNGVVHEGYWSTLLGLPGWPAAGEEVIVARNILLAELCDHHIHCQHISAAGSVRLLREARARGVKISGEVCPHHIALTDEAVQNFDTNCKMNPPLRTQARHRGAAGRDRGRHDRRFWRAITRRTRSSKRKWSSTTRLSGSLGWKRSSGCSSTCSSTRRKTIDLPRLIEMFTIESGAIVEARAPARFRPGAGRHHADRSGPGMDGGGRDVSVALAQHAVRRLGAARPRRADDRRRQDRLEAVAAR